MEATIRYAWRSDVSCLCGAVTASYTSEETALETAAICVVTLLCVSGFMFGGLKLLQQSSHTSYFCIFILWAATYSMRQSFRD